MKVCHFGVRSKEKSALGRRACRGRTWEVQHPKLLGFLSYFVFWAVFCLGLVVQWTVIIILVFCLNGPGKIGPVQYICNSSKGWRA